MTHSATRRSFLKQSALAAGSIALATHTRRARAAQSASGEVRVAVIAAERWPTASPRSAALGGPISATSTNA